MPHQCTNCGRHFPDGSKEMLSGCPDCGGNKFQFQPSGASSSTASDSGAGGSAPSGSSSAADAGDTGTGSSGSRAFSADSGAASGTADSSASPSAGGTDDPSPPETTSTESSPRTTSTEPSSETTPATPSDASRPDDEKPRGRDSPSPGAEDVAQADARRDVVSRDELATASEGAPRSRPPEDADGQVIEPTDDDRPDLGELREQLNDQFESIRIVNPGQYELNLMELYDRQEYIISLQEDGKYVIDVPDAWRSAGDE